MSIRWEHFRRIWVIVFIAIRFYRQVWWFEKKIRMGAIQNVNEAWDQLTASQAREYRDTALKLQGLTIKVGQFLSTRADVMPPGFIRELRSLTDRVPPMPFEKAIRILEQDWQSPMSNHVASLSNQPVAAASIADVYRAKLHDGTEVAIKIQRDGIEKVLRADFQAIRIVIGLVKRFTNWGKWTDFDRLYAEFVQIVSRELDFILERKHAQRFEKLISGLDGVSLPIYVDRLTTRRVLVMTWVEGKPITDGLQIKKTGLTRNEINQRLLKAFFRQILEAGFFHADPHPGNLLLADDGTIYWLDFGMMGEIRADEMLAIRKGLIALILRRFDLVTDALEQLQFLNAQSDKKKLSEVIRLTFELYTERNMSEIDQAALEELLQTLRDFVQNQPIQLPAQYAFLGRAFSLMSGVLSEVDPNVDFFELGKPIVEPWLNFETREKNQNQNDEPSNSVFKEMVSRLETIWHFAKPVVEPLQNLLLIPDELLQTLQSLRTKEERLHQLRQIELERNSWRSQQVLLLWLGILFWCAAFASWIWIDVRFMMALLPVAVGCLWRFKVLDQRLLREDQGSFSQGRKLK